MRHSRIPAARALPAAGDLPPVQFKGVSRVHPDVIVRLETPVIYFYSTEKEENGKTQEAASPQASLRQFLGGLTSKKASTPS